MASKQGRKSQHPEWWRGSAIYQIYPRSFCDSDGDGVGDLKGITSKLDYVAKLGVDAVWLSPFFTSPMADFGYDVSDYRNVDPLFGTLKDFDVMLKAMHKRGLKLIIDLVLNHTSEKHAWFAESRKSRDNKKADWYVWADPKPDGTAPNNWLSVFGGPAWRYETKRGQYYLHTFLREQPELNVGNPEVQDALIGIMKFWLDKGVDGIRLDAVSHYMHDEHLRDNPPRPVDDTPTSNLCKSAYSLQRQIHNMFHPENPAFLRRLRALTDKYKDRMMVAELGGDEEPLKRYVEYTGAPDMLHTAYNFSFLGPRYDAALFRETVMTLRNASDYCWPAWAFSNHDFPRVVSRWKQGKESPAQAKMLMALLCSIRGTPFIYEGEELGLPDVKLTYDQLQDPYGKYLWPESQGRDGCRTPMPWDGAKKNAGFSKAAKPWLPIPKNHMKNSVAAQEKDKKSALHFTRNFLKWRKAFPALVTGDIAFADAREPVVAFTRMQGEENIFCAFNLGARPVTVALPKSCTALDGHGLPYKLKGDVATLPAFGGFFGKI